jgi:hypothetical protein
LKSVIKRPSAAVLDSQSLKTATMIHTEDGWHNSILFRHPLRLSSFYPYRKLDDVRLFFDVMKSLGDRKIWIHCALNMRVSCFLYLFQKHVLHLPEEQASYPMAEIWQPEGVWKELIQETDKILS